MDEQNQEPSFRVVYFYIFKKQKNTLLTHVCIFGVYS